ncbi:MAG: 2-oxoacid:acceptor oxidoreductase family protein [Candidatus Heimdallarchaeota archaeon]
MTDKIIDIRLHGRGGQGVMTSSYLIAEAALLEDKHVHAFPTFGPERSGAPIAAFARISDEKFYIKSEIYEPDIVVVQDPSLLGQIDVTAGLLENGIILINTSDPFSESIKTVREKRPDARLATVNASRIAREEIGLTVTNTAILGAMCRITGERVITLKALEKAINHRFKDKADIAYKNVNAIKRSYQEVVN